VTTTQTPAAGLPTRPAAVPHRPDWRADAICAQVDPELFYPDAGRSTAAAKRVCMGCPARRACLDYALAHGENTGIWGGTTPDQRKAMRRTWRRDAA
jgi:WhiB family redox-sensing transcriptional regulator